VGCDVEKIYICESPKFIWMQWRKYEMAKIPKSEQSRNTRLVGITSQKNKWVNTDPRRYRSKDKVPRRSKHSRWTQFQMPVVKITVSKLGKRNNPLSKSVCSVR
jgi:hypothetical protein